MTELKVIPKNDALVGPAMNRCTDSIYKILKDYVSGYSIKRDTFAFRRKLEIVLYQYMFLAAERGYDLAIRAGELKPMTEELSSLKRLCKRRALFSARRIAGTTVRALEGTALEIMGAIGKKNAATKNRAEGITGFEVPRMMFLGMRKGWNRVTGNRLPTKRWFTVSDNPCELCIENEDVGPIPLDDPFPSGDYEPTIHINCDCILGLYV